MRNFSIYSIFVSFVMPLYADAAASTTADGQSGLHALMPVVLIFAVFYFLLIRPQQKREKERQTMLCSITKGEKVITSGGIIATVKDTPSDTEIDLEIASGVVVRFLKNNIVDVPERAPRAPAINNKTMAEVKKEAKEKKTMTEIKREISEKINSKQ